MSRDSALSDGRNPILPLYASRLTGGRKERLQAGGRERRIAVSWDIERGITMAQVARRRCSWETVTWRDRIRRR